MLVTPAIRRVAELVASLALDGEQVVTEVIVTDAILFISTETNGVLQFHFDMGPTANRVRGAIGGKRIDLDQSGDIVALVQVLLALPQGVYNYQ